MKKTMTSVVLAFSLAGAANAGIIDFDFTGGSGQAAFYDFTVDGITTTATATYNGFSNSADVTRSGSGIGVNNSWLDSDQIDGSGREDYLTLSFSNEVELLGFTFGHSDWNDEFDLYVDGSAAGYNFDTDDGLAAFSPSTFLGSAFTVRANGGNDNFVISSMRISVADVPEPGTLALLGLGLAGLGLSRRRQQA